MKADTKADDEDDDDDDDDDEDELAADAVGSVASVAAVDAMADDEDEDVVDVDSVGNMEGTSHLSYRFSLLKFCTKISLFAGFVCTETADSVDTAFVHRSGSMPRAARSTTKNFQNAITPPIRQS